MLRASGSWASSCDCMASALGGARSAGDGMEPQGVVRIGETKFLTRPSRNSIRQEIVPFASSRKRPDAVPERGEVGVAARVDRVLRAGLDAGVALPAHVGLDVVGAAIGLVDVHDVRGTDIDAVSATVAARHVDECRHRDSASRLNGWMDGWGVISSSGAAGARCRRPPACRPGAAACSSIRPLPPPVSGGPPRA